MHWQAGQAVNIAHLKPMEQRLARFDELCWRFRHRRIGKLVAVHRVDRRVMDQRIAPAARRFLEAANRSTTPNGMVVPTRESGLEFNALCREFYAVIASLNIQDCVDGWAVPLNLRLKRDGVRSNGPRATEMRHSDAWVNENGDNCLVSFPIVGCSPDNHVKFFDPPDDFDDSWLSPRDFKAGQEIADRYAPLDFVPEDGELVMADYATIHQTVRKSGAADRVSIDTTFGVKMPGEDVSSRKYRGLRCGWDVVTGLGQTHLLVFPNRSDEWVDCLDGMRQAVNCQVKELK
jgi:hypothetical protein